MTLSDIASLGSLVSGVAVLVSLVYLSLQVKQAERNQQAQIRQGRASRTVSIQLGGLEPSIAEALEKGFQGGPDISRTQYLQSRRYLTALFYNAEDSYFQHSEGLLSEASLAGIIAGWKGAFSSPGIRAIWKAARVGFEPGFVSFMDKIMSEVAVAPDSDAFAKWQAEVVAEKSMIAH